MERQVRNIGDLINVMGTIHLEFILKVRRRLVKNKFYLFNDITNKKKSITKIFEFLS